MTKSKTVLAAMLASMLIAAPAFAQEAIQEPGAFAFYHPDADVLNSGAPARIEMTGAMASVPYDGSAYDSYAYVGPAHAVRHGRVISRNAATSIDEAAPAYGWDNRACIPAPRVGAFATQPWDTQTPCEPSY